MKKICFVTSTPMTMRAFMSNHFRALSGLYVLTAISDFHSKGDCSGWSSGIQCVSIPIARPIRPLSDIVSLIELYRHFRTNRYDAVHSITPKAGLLAMLAALMAGIPLRIHCFTGQVWATRNGLAREMLKRADKLIVSCATHVLTDSYSQRDFLEAEGVLSSGQGVVLGHGSISGVDYDRFCPDSAVRERIRRELGIPQDALLYVYLGRLNRDKGVLDLAQAFSMLAQKCNDAWLLIVGPDEAGISAQIYDRCRSVQNRVIRVDYTSTPENYMASSDVFVLPSYREGFGSVIIEAAACGVPAVASCIYGLTDAVADGETGLLYPAGDIEKLLDSLLRFYDDPVMRVEMGMKARERAVTNFSMDYVTSEMMRFYSGLMHEDTLPSL